MYIVNEEDKEYRFGDSGPKYLMKGPRMNFALVQFQAGQDFKAHYHNVMEENFYILEGEVDIVVDGVVNHLRPGQMIHIEPGEIHYVINNSGAPMKMISTLAPYTFLLSVPLCRMMMYWWFANPMRCMKSLPSSAQSASVKVALSSIEGLTSKRRQLFFTFGKSM